MEEREVLIDVDHVSMHYHLPAQKVTSLKEFVVKFLKRQLKYRDFHVLDDVSMKIYRGESVAILGRNGVGKSTLLKIVSGIIPCTSGNVTVNGSIVPMLQVGAGFDPEATGRENVFLNGAILGYTKKEMEAKYDEIVKFAEIPDFMNVPVKNYSSGMKSRLGFAIAVNSHPDLIIIDEVLSVGDSQFQNKCRQKMIELKQSGVTFVVVSHSKAAVKMLCDRIIFIKDHRIEADSYDIDAIYKMYETEE